MPRASAGLTLALVLCALWAGVVASRHRPLVDEAVASLERAMAAAPSARLAPDEVSGLPDVWQEELAHVVAGAGPRDEGLSQAAAVLEARVHELPSWRFGWIPSRPSGLGWLTYLFVHTELLHLLANLVLFWFVATTLEVRVGPERTSAVFLLAGAAGAGAHLMLHGASTVPLVGASASVAGVLGALLVHRPPARLPFVFLWGRGPRASGARLHIPLVAILLLWVGLETLAWVEPSAAPTALGAHLGGLVAGGALGRALISPQSP